jgi:putative ABC transport system permease protein
MIKNYLRVALRNLWRHRGFSFLNIVGLSVGMAAFFLIFLYVSFELSYDSFHSKADRLYRIVADVKTPTEVLHYNAPPAPATTNMPGYLPEVQSTLRVTLGDNWMVIRGDRTFELDDVAMADSNFFGMFDFPLLKGNPLTALKDPFSIVLTESAAKKFFGNADPMGQSLTLTRDQFHGTVTGLMKDLPENSHIKASMIISLTTFTMKLNPDFVKDWDNYGVNEYLLLKPGASPAALQAKFPAYLQTMAGAQLHPELKMPTLLLEPVRDVYLYSTRDGARTGNITNVKIFSIIGCFILLIAAINFVNLTTARSAERAKEVGIRKVVGAGKSMLAGQFIGESILLCGMAFLLSLVFAQLSLPAFNQLAGNIVCPGVFSQARYPMILLGIALLIGTAAGLYPALVLSSFQPMAVLKGRFSMGTRGLFLRKTLVIIQFTIAIGLIIGTLVVYRQLGFMRSQDLGFSMDQELILDTRNDSAKLAFKQEVSMMPGVISTSLSSGNPGMNTYTGRCRIENYRGDMQTTDIDMYAVDFDYLSQLNMKMVAGRPFSRGFGMDTANAMILNETAVRMLGYPSPEQAIARHYDESNGGGTIVGVVKDFHFHSLKERIRPLSLRIRPLAGDLLCAKVDGRRVTATLAAIEQKWKQMLPDRPFTYFFLDEFFDRQYRDENRFGKLFLHFAILAIIISCLGLMGLASYSTIQRTKEIGVRKVIGASVGNIVLLLSEDFLKLVGWSFLIAAPLSWFFTDRWLRDFAYRIRVGWEIFLLAGVLAMLVALLTISFQAVRAAVANPVKSLRSE